MTGRVARVVVVTRKTPLELLIQRWGTYGQAKFYLSTRGQTIDRQEELHARLDHGVREVLAAMPSDQRVARVDRDALDRFLFAPDDVVAIVGQDGLVPNVAKYLSGQLTFGVNPDPAHYDGVLCAFPPGAVPSLLSFAANPGVAHPLYQVSPRTMAVARREDGQELRALNEIFVGHASHQSARYLLQVGDESERQSSSGLIVSTGTGATGWARSILEQRGIDEPLPAPSVRRLLWLVREPFPSVSTGTSMDYGILGRGESLIVTSAMGEGGIIFADGIESDRLEFADGQTVTIQASDVALRLVSPRPPPEEEGRVSDA
jgi:NAD kinase